MPRSRPRRRPRVSWRSVPGTVPGRAHIDAAGASSEGKAIWVIAGDDTKTEILAGDNPASSIVIDSSVFKRNGVGTRFSHNTYINHVRIFTLRYSYSTNAFVGHLVKSRALRNFILYDRLTGERGNDSYELDLPNGGLSYVIGTVLQQGAGTQNSNMLAYGEEGSLNPHSRLYAINDTFVNDLGRGDAVFVAPAAGSGPAIGTR